MAPADADDGGGPPTAPAAAAAGPLRPPSIEVPPPEQHMPTRSRSAAEGRTAADADEDHAHAAVTTPTGKPRPKSVALHPSSAGTAGDACQAPPPSASSSVRQGRSPSVQTTGSPRALRSGSLARGGSNADLRAGDLSSFRARMMQNFTSLMTMPLAEELPTSASDRLLDDDEALHTSQHSASRTTSRATSRRTSLVARMRRGKSSRSTTSTSRRTDEGEDEVDVEMGRSKPLAMVLEGGDGARDSRDVTLEGLSMAAAGPTPASPLASGSGMIGPPPSPSLRAFHDSAEKTNFANNPLVSALNKSKAATAADLKSATPHYYLKDLKARRAWLERAGMHRFSLKFLGDQSLEDSYQAYLTQRSVLYLRYSFSVLLPVYMILGFTDETDSDAQRETRNIQHALRYSAALAGWLFVWFTFSARFPRWMQTTLVSLLMVGGTCIVLSYGLYGADADVRAQENYMVSFVPVLGVMSYHAFVCNFARLRFVYAVPVSIYIFVFYISMAAMQTRDGIDGEETGKEELLEVIFTLLVAEIIGLCSSYFFEYYLRRDYLMRRMLQDEQAQSQELLARMLPDSVIPMLKEGHRLIAEECESVTVLFCQVMGLDKAKSAPEMIDALDRVFGDFDRLCDKHGLYKVETIGSVFMVVGGLPEPSARHAHDIAALALDMVAAAGQTSVSGHSLQARCGINTGPIVAGVIGLKAPRYRLFGDTVNTGSRMQTHAAPGKIHMSIQTAQLLADDFVLSERGFIKIKGKGTMATYYLEGRADPFADKPSLRARYKWLSAGGQHDKKPRPLSMSDLSKAVMPESPAPEAPEPSDGGESTPRGHTVYGSVPKKNMYKGALEHPEKYGLTNANFRRSVAALRAEEEEADAAAARRRAPMTAESASMAVLRKRAESNLTSGSRSAIDSDFVDLIHLRTQLDSFAFDMDAEMHPVTLGFLDRDLEKAYAAHFAVISLRAVRAGAIMAVVFTTMFAILDFASGSGDGLTVLARVMRVIGILLAGGFLWLSFTRFYRRHQQACLLVTLILVGLAFSGVKLAKGLIGVDVLALYVLFVFLISRLRFILATGLAWGSLLFFDVLFYTENEALKDKGKEALASDQTLIEYNLFLGLIIVLSMLASYIMDQYTRRDYLAKRVLGRETEMLEYLISSLVPRAIVPLLKDGRQIAEQHNDVAVVFADIVGFTSMAAAMEPNELVEMLNYLFVVFDLLTDLHNVYKVETIGDAYVIAGGIGTEIYNDHPLASSVQCALDMVAALAMFQDVTGRTVRVRIGVHCGPLVAGVVGHKMPRYHVWGDTVDLASVMEQNSVPSGVMVSAAAQRRIADLFSWEEQTFTDLNGTEHRAFLASERRSHAQFKRTSSRQRASSIVQLADSFRQSPVAPDSSVSTGSARGSFGHMPNGSGSGTATGAGAGAGSGSGSGPAASGDKLRRISSPETVAQRQMAKNGLKEEGRRSSSPASPGAKNSRETELSPLALER